MNAKYLRSNDSLLFSKVRVDVRFKDTDITYSGPVEGYRKFAQSNPKLAILSTEVNGKKGGLYVTFKPSNKEQRDFLAKRLGVRVLPGQNYTFGSREGAIPFHKAMTAAGIKTDKRQWQYGACEHTQASLPF